MRRKRKGNLILNLLHHFGRIAFRVIKGITLSAFLLSRGYTQLPPGSQVDEFSGSSLDGSKWICEPGRNSGNVGLIYQNGRIYYDWAQVKKLINSKYFNTYGVSLKYLPPLPENQPWTVLAKCHLDVQDGWNGGPYSLLLIDSPAIFSPKIVIELTVCNGQVSGQHDPWANPIGRVATVFQGIDWNWSNMTPKGYFFNFYSWLTQSETDWNNTGGQKWIGFIYRPDQKTLSEVYAESSAGELPQANELRLLGPAQELPEDIDEFSIYLNLINQDQLFWDISSMTAGQKSSLKDYGSFDVDRFIILPYAMGIPPTVKDQIVPATVGQSLAYQVLATENPTSFSCTNLPTGISLGATTGILSGTPTQAGNFNLTVTASNSLGQGFGGVVKVQVAKGTSAILSSPSASGIIYGQALTSSSLSGGTATIPGFFAWTDSSITPSAGTSSQSVTFTPSDSANYNPATTTVSVAVNKATPSITTPPTADAITRGQTLASSALRGGSASVAGAFAWTTSSIAPNVGTSGQSVTFTPTDTGNYNTTTTTVNVTVNKGTPTITTAPAAGKITYGQTLASSTLNGGSANVAGRFAWTTPSQAPRAGTTNPSVTFTPTDTANYGTTTTTVSLVVDKKLLTGGFTVSHKEYDRNNSATVVTRSVNGRVGVDDVSHTGGAATFNSSAVGNNKPVTLSGATLTGAAANNYTLGTIAPTTANITPKALTITGASATSRPFNGSTAVAVSGGSLSGVVSGDTVTLGGSPTGTMANANAGTGKAVTVTGYAISGASAANYTVSQPTGLTVNITKLTPTISKAPTASAIYQGQILANSTLSGGTASVAGTFTWTTPSTAPSAGTSSHSVTFTPTDVVNYNTTTTTVSLVVNPPPPIITSDTTPVTITNRASYSYTITASGSPTAFEAAGLPQGLSVNRTSGLISGAPTQNGTFTVTLRALRTGVPTGTATKVFTVVSPPTPVINSDLSAVNVNLNANYFYQITASGSPTSYGATGLPSGLVINTTTGIISGKPNKTGTFTVTLQALKTGGTTGTATKVFNVVQAPSFSYAPTNTVNLNANVNITPTVTGFPAPTFSVILGTLPAGLSLNTSTAAITGKPTARGTNAIVVRGANSAGNTDRPTIIVVR